MKNREVSEESYLQFGRFLEQQCGIVLGENKQYLVRSRLSSLLYTYNVDALDTLINKVVTGRDKNMLQSVIDAMTTNETLWFRDTYPFELLVNRILPEFSTLSRPLKIWSAACSSGQEPYSIAMSVLEFQRQNPSSLKRGVEIVATDLSTSMLARCEEGIYDELSLARGLSEERRQRYFTRHEDGRMMVKPELKRMVTFRSMNLLHSYANLGKFDLVFCRNVLIYFAPAIKQKILQQIAGLLQPNGILFLGASESISTATAYFNMVKCSPGLYYQRKP
ncbi:CheR family methyltransferase [Alteromonas sp. ASW11-130]|uniref:CheR family methyltransferase n=1 Tax=Alteromonas sp. ASW11-130 TaxID=3015775 RepID=UPI0022420FD2|nr:protein-glutamate O-methyltransferase CheR [Alteromonas sp. ASW11-130]MCW8091817.1 protein-glutamate O-methyltransferase CheR [Alteromonas sp. ASW11-130]